VAKTKTKILIFLAGLFLTGSFYLFPTAAMAREINCAIENCSGMAGYWKLNETGSTFYDSSGNNNTGTLAGSGSSAVSGKESNAQNFNGSGYITVPDSPSITISGSLTVTAWINTTSTAKGLIVSKQSTVSYWPGWGFALTGGGGGSTCTGYLNYANDNAGWHCSTSNGYNDGSWHHVAVVHSGSTATFYKDGVANGTVSAGALNTTTTTPLSIGSWNGVTSNFAGTIDEVTVWNRALSADEIQNLYSIGDIILPTLTSVSPNSGQATAQTPVTLYGSGFLTGVGVTFDGITATNITRVNSSTITCTTPTHSAGAVNVKVTNTNTGSVILTNGYTYYAAPTVTSITPVAAINNASAGISNITGTAFRTGAIAKLTKSGSPDISLTTVYSNSSTLTATIPAPSTTYPTGLYNVVVTNTDSQNGFLSNGFTMSTRPTISSLNVNSGPAAGGGQITITGTNFIPGATTAVKFGGTSAGGVTVNSSTQIKANIPSGTGSVNVTVINPASLTSLETKTYQYFPMPTISTVVPNIGTTAGGTVITINGANFYNSTVTVGGITCTNNPANDTSAAIICVTPSEAIGAKDVIVTTPTGAVTKTGGFTYAAPPAISNITNDNGETLGGAAITIEGTNFTNGASVKFGETASPSVTFKSSTKLEAVTPVHDAGIVNITVINPNTISVSASSAFTFAELAVTKLGDGTFDYSIPADPGSSQLIFTISINQAQKNIIQNALTAGANKNLTYVWSNNNKTLTISHAAITTFDNDVIVTLTHSNAAVSDLLLIDSLLSSAQKRVTPAEPNVILNSTVNEAVLNTMVPASISIPADVNDASINIDSLTTTAVNNVSGTLPAITVNSTNNSVNMLMEIPAETLVSSAVTWNSKIELPKVKPLNSVTVVPTPGKTAEVKSVIAIGSETESLSFNNGVRLKFINSAGRLVGFYKNSTFTPITSTCSSDTQSAGNGLPADGDCKKDSDADLIVWTKHFTDYVLYDEKIIPTVATIYPNFGAPAGGTVVTITGTNFDPTFGNSSTVTFGGITANNIQVMDTTSLTAETPIHASGAVTVVVTNPDGENVIKTGAFTYAQPPNITSVSPTRGPTGGGTNITIRGTLFRANPKVYFGANESTKVTYISPTQIEAALPGGAPGSESVRVVNTPDNQDDVLLNGFTYFPSPAISTFSPTSGTNNETINSFTVSGADFQSGDSVILTNTEDYTILCTNTVVTQTQITCKLKLNNKPRDGYTVMVKSRDGQSISSANKFILESAAPSVSSVTPVIGTTMGGTSVVVTASNLDNYVYKIPVAISNSGTALTEYQVTIRLDTAAIIAEGKMKKDCGDLRILDSQYSTMPYFIESGCNTSNTVVAAKVPKIDAGENSIYAVYGNFTLTSKSNGNKTFELFDDFNGTTLDSDLWTVINPTSPAQTNYSVNGGYLNMTIGDTVIDSKYIYDSSIEMDTSVKMNPIIVGPGKTQIGHIIIRPTAVNNGPMRINTATADGGWCDGCTQEVGAPQANEVILNEKLDFAGNQSLVCYNNNCSPLHTPDKVYLQNNNNLGIANLGNYTYAVHINWIGIRKHADSEPEITNGDESMASIIGFGLGSYSNGTVTTIIGPNRISTLTPAHIPAEKVNIKITNPDDKESAPENLYTYSPPHLTASSPEHGPSNGGQSIIITGHYFSPNITVAFGGAPYFAENVTVINESTITAATPAHAPGTVNLTVTNTDSTADTLSDYYIFDKPPAADSLSPANGPANGGTNITIGGTDFKNGASVKVDDTLSLGVEFVSENEIQFILPAHIAGLADVSVINPDGQISTLIDGITIDQRPIVTAIVPNHGSSLGSESINIQGSNFALGAAVLLDNKNTSGVTWIDSETLTATTPIHAAAPAGTPVQIKVINPDGQNSTDEIPFTYYAPPVIQSIYPPAGPPNVQTNISIKGNNFRAGVAVQIGTESAVNVTRNSTTSIDAAVPAQAAGLYEVKVINTDNQEDTVADGFKYGTPPTASSINIIHGPASGGTVVEITGSTITDGATVRFGTREATAVTTLSPTLIRATTPANPAGLSGVTIINPDTQSSTISGGFTYDSWPSITSITPAWAVTEGAIDVSIAGSDFVSGITVKFGETASPDVTYTSASSLTAAVPAHIQENVDVIVTNPDGQIFNLTKGFNYYSAPTITRVSPTTGKETGGDSIDIYGSNFRENQTSVKFGDVEAAGVIVESPGHLVAQTPVHSTGTVNITVTNSPDNRSAFLSAALTFVAKPRITNFTPEIGQIKDSSVPFTITGSDFQSGANVTLTNSDNITAECVDYIISATEINCNLYLIGKPIDGWKVKVTNPDGQFDLASTIFKSKQLPPVLTGVQPNSGPTTGGKDITILGINFPNHIYKKAITITNSKDPVSDHVIQIITDTKTIIAEGKMRSDCGDLRIFDTNEYTTLPYFIEDGCNTESTYIAIRVPEIAASKTIYIGYGNLSMTGTSNGKTTFDFFDGFDDIALDSSVWVNATGNYYLNNGALHVKPTCDTPTTILSNISYDQPFIIESSFKNPSPFYKIMWYGQLQVGHILAYHSNGGSYTNYTGQELPGLLISSNNLYVATDDNTIGANKNHNLLYPAASTTFAQEIYDPAANSSTVCRYDHCSSSHVIGTRLVPDSTKIGIGMESVCMQSIFTDPPASDINWIGTRKYQAVEPAIEIGAEELYPLILFVDGEDEIPATKIVIHAPYMMIVTTPLLPNSGGVDTAPRHVNLKIDRADGEYMIFLPGFTYYAPSLISVNPNHGPSTLNANITLKGLHFGTGAAVKFNENSSTQVTYINNETQIVQTPINDTGIVSVTLTNSDGHHTTLSNSYTFDPPPTITDINPIHGPRTIGTTITIRGTHFAPGMNVKIGMTAATNLIVRSPTELTAVTGIAPAGGNFDITVQLSDQQIGVLPQGFYYDPTPEITTLTPNFAIVPGGNSITIDGEYFMAGATVTFDDITSPDIQFINTQQIIAVSPPHAIEEPVDFKVINPDGQMKLIAINYLATPQITAIIPPAGPPETQTEIEIRGTHLGLNPSILIGDQPATGVTSTQETTIHATVPAQALGTYNVTYIKNEVQNLLINNGYSYNYPPTISAVNSLGAAPGTGTIVSISGTNFVEGAAVKFGSVSGTGVQFISAEAITAVIPVNNIGRTNVTVTNPDTQSATLIDGFSGPKITSIEENFATLDGGKTITITGTVFADTAAVKFGETPAMNVIHDSETQLTVNVPVHDEGTVDLIITNPNQQTAAAGFTFYAQPTIQSLSINHAPTSGWTNITITGTKFREDTTVKFDNTEAVRVIYNSPTSLTVKTPAHSAGEITITVTNHPDEQTAVTDFTFQDPPTVTSFNPASAATGDLVTEVVISGLNFDPNAEVTLHNAGKNDIDCTNAVITATEITCDFNLSGALPDGWRIQITNEDGQKDLSFDTFKINDLAPTLIGVNPLSGPTAGGTYVTLTGSGFPRFTFMRPVTISNPGADLIEYQIEMVLDTASLISEGKMRSDCGDLRVIDSDEYSTLPYIIAEGCNTARTTVITKIPKIEYQKIIYIAYGNHTYESSQNPEEIYDFFEDFNGTSLNREVWVPQMGNYTVADGHLNLFNLWGNTCPEKDNPCMGWMTGQTTIIDSDIFFNSSFIVDTVANVIGNKNDNVGQIGHIIYDNAEIGNPPAYAILTASTDGTSAMGHSQGVNYERNKEFFTKEIFNNTTQNANTCTGGNCTGYHPAGTRIAPAEIASHLTLNSYVSSQQGGNGNAYSINWIGLRKYTENEPTVSVDAEIDKTQVRFWINPSESAANGIVLDTTQMQVTAPEFWPDIQTNISLERDDGQSATLLDSYDFVLPVAANISPEHGSSAGGNTITITGTDFSSTVEIYMGGELATNVNVANGTTITAVTPVHLAGTVDVEVVNSDLQSTILEGAYTFDEGPVIQSVNPISGSLEGGTAVTITGLNFVDEATVNIGGIDAVSVTYINAETLHAVTAPNTIGLKSIIVTVPDGQSGTLADSFTYDHIPSISTITPASGTSAGGKIIIIEGDNFQPGVTVTFDILINHHVEQVSSPDVTWLNTNRILAETPANNDVSANGTLTNITVTNSNGLKTIAEGAYTYYLPPTITSVYPPAGPPNENTNISISGTNFRSGAIVKIGGLNALNVVRNGTTGISAQSPAQTLGSRDLTVTNTPDNQKATLADGFSYNLKPDVISIDPVGSSGSGGIAATITGNNFVEGAGLGVKFGTVPATNVVRISGTQLSLTVPAHSGGAVDVSVINPDTQIGTLADGFAFVAAPTITSITPPYGPALGGTAVTINGADFSETPSVKFDTIASPEVTKINNETLVVVIPPHAATAFGTPTNVEVKNNDNQINPAYNNFTYYNAPIIAELKKPAGSPDGGDKVIIKGENFREGISVKFGETNSTNVTFLTDQMITAITPAHLSGIFDVTVKNTPDLQSVTAPDSYSYFTAPTVTTFSPLSAINTEADIELTVHGFNFRAGAQVQLINSELTEIQCTGPQITSNNITCSLNLVGIKSDGWQVFATNTDGQTARAENAFAIYNIPGVINSINPVEGSSLGGNSVTIVGTNMYKYIYKRPVVINNPNNSLTDYQIELELNTADLIADHKMRSDCGDMRFIDSDNYSELPYFLENGCNTTSTVVVIKIPLIPSFGKTINMTYGNPDLTSISSGIAAMDFFDDFNGADINTGIWRILQGNYTVTAGKLKLANPNCIQGPACPANSSVIMDSDILFDNSTVVDAKITQSANIQVNNKSQIANIILDHRYASNVDLALLTTSSDDELAQSDVKYHTGISTLVKGIINKITDEADACYNNACTGFHNYSNGLALVTDRLTLVNEHQYSPHLNTGSVINIDWIGTRKHAPKDLLASVGSEYYAATLTFDTTPKVSAANIRSQSAAQITAETPVHLPNLVDININTLDNRSSSLASSFTFKGPIPTDVFPTHITYSGGTSITISGQHFRNGAYVKINDILAQNVTLINTGTITATVPPGTIGPAEIIVTNADSEFGVLSGKLFYVDPAEYGPVNPSFGTTLGGTTITIRGTNLFNILTVTLGTSPCTNVTFINSEQVSCVTGTSTVLGPVDVTTVNIDEIITTMPDAFTYIQNPPVITGVAPDNSPSTGNTTVMISGTGFCPAGSPSCAPGLTIVKFDNISSSFVSVLNSTTIRAATPAHSAAMGGTSVTVSVTNPDTQTATLDNGFTYTAANQVCLEDAVPKDTLTMSNNNTLITDFSMEKEITVPQNSIAPKIDLSPLMKIEGPNKTGKMPKIKLTFNRSGGAVEVQIPQCTGVTAPNTWDGKLNALQEKPASDFTQYINELSDPGKSASITSVTSIGDDLQNLSLNRAVRIIFTGMANKKVAYIRSGSVGKITAECSANTQLAGDELTENGDCFFNETTNLIVWTKHFTDYIVYEESEAPTVTGVLPASGTTAGGTTVTISGTNFGSNETQQAQATFGGADATQELVLNNTQMTAVTPAHGVGPVDVTVTNPNSLSGTKTNGYEYTTQEGGTQAVCGEPGSSRQCATQEITCYEGSLSFGHTPDSVTFDSQVASGNSKQSYDSTINDNQPLSDAHILSVIDSRSNNVTNCPLSLKGFIVQAEATPLYNGNGTSPPIPNTNLRVITGNDLNPLPGSCEIADGLEACYGAAEGTGNLRDITAPVLYDDFARLLADQYLKFNQPDPYLWAAENDPSSTAAHPQGNASPPTPLLNILNGPVDLLTTHTSHNQTIYTGVAVKAEIPAGQDPGTYTGTITYTLSAQ
jgi:hypothetical protein